MGDAYPGLYDPRITKFSAKSAKRCDYPRVFTVPPERLITH